jgi:hypothetical protein
MTCVVMVASVEAYNSRGTSEACGAPSSIVVP